MTDNPERKQEIDRSNKLIAEKEREKRLRETEKDKECVIAATSEGGRG